MRIVIDKDVSEIQLLNEAYKRSNKRYKVLAVENGEKFVYGKGLLLNEVSSALEKLSEDDMFKGCSANVVECSKDGRKENIIWDSDSRTMVSESTMYSEGWKEAWHKFADGAKRAAAALGDIFKNNPITKFFKDKIEEWKKNNYITNDNELTGLGYKIAVGEVKPPQPKPVTEAEADGGDDL